MREQTDISASALYSTIPLLPELEQSFMAIVGSCGDLGMEGLRRAMLATDALEDTGVCGAVGGCGGGEGLSSCSPLRHDPSLHYEVESLQLSDTADLCRLSHLRLQSTSDPILLGQDRHLGDDPHEADVMYTELTNNYRELSPSGSSGDCGLEPELSDSSSSESCMESPGSDDQWDPMGDSGVSISMDPDGPLPPVSDIFAHRLNKEDFADMAYINRSLPLFIKAERVDSEDDSLEGCPRIAFRKSSSSSSSSSSSTSPSTFTYTTIYTHLGLPSSSPATTTSATTLLTSLSTTTSNSNHHDYTTAPCEDVLNNNGDASGAAAKRMGESVWGAEESSQKSVHVQRHQQQQRQKTSRSDRSRGLEEGEKSQQRKKPGRKKGQVSKVLHLWEFIRDLLSDPNYCPRIISWENETEGVFRVQHSSEVARLWGEKKKNKKTMTYEKLSRSLRYSRKEGYFDALPRDRGYPKKLCFKFGPKSHGWNEDKV